MQTVKDEYEAKGISMITISGDRGEDLKRFWQDNELDITVLTDINMEIARSFGVRSYPAGFFLDAAGNVIDSKVGWGGDCLEDWKAKVDDYLAS